MENELTKSYTIVRALDALNFDAGDWKPENVESHLRRQIELAKEILSDTGAVEATEQHSAPVQYSYKQPLEEWFREGHDSIADALQAARKAYGTDDNVLIGILTTLDANDISAAFDPAEDIKEYLYDNFGDPAGDNFEMDTEAEKELSEFIRFWANKHNLFGAGGCGLVSNIKTYSLKTGEIIETVEAEQ